MVAAQEPTVFQALGHEEDQDWALGLERERGLARAPQRARAEPVCWEFGQGVQDALVADEEREERGSPQ